MLSGSWDLIRFLGHYLMPRMLPGTLLGTWNVYLVLHRRGCLYFSIEGDEWWMINALHKAQATSGHRTGKSGENGQSWAQLVGLGLKPGAQGVWCNCPPIQ